MSRSRDLIGLFETSYVYSVAFSRPILHPDQGTDMSEQQQAPGVQQANEIVVDDSATSPAYSNFCRVTATPEEVILDFGLNPQPFATGRQEVKVGQRLVMNFFTAKRLLMALGTTIQRHEGAFGAIEVDVNRRVNGSMRIAPQFTQAEGMQPDQQHVIKLDR
jgi:hypothetical protein